MLQVPENSLCIRPIVQPHFACSQELPPAGTGSGDTPLDAARSP